MSSNLSHPQIIAGRSPFSAYPRLSEAFLGKLVKALSLISDIMTPGPETSDQEYVAVFRLWYLDTRKSGVISVDSVPAV